MNHEREDLITAEKLNKEAAAAISKCMDMLAEINETLAKTREYLKDFMEVAK